MHRGCYCHEHKHMVHTPSNLLLVLTCEDYILKINFVKPNINTLPPNNIFRSKFFQDDRARRSSRPERRTSRIPANKFYEDFAVPFFPNVCNRDTSSDPANPCRAVASPLAESVCSFSRTSNMPIPRPMPPRNPLPPDPAMRIPSPKLPPCSMANTNTQPNRYMEKANSKQGKTSPILPSTSYAQ